jgi:hypothetical protein
MLGLKCFRCASITIAGAKLMHRIRKGQFKLGTLRITHKTAPKSGTQFSSHEPRNAAARSVALISRSLRQSLFPHRPIAGQ